MIQNVKRFSFIGLFMLTDFVFFILIWFIQPSALYFIAPFILLFSFFSWGLLYRMQASGDRKIIQYIYNYVNDPNEQNLFNLTRNIPKDWLDIILNYTNTLQRQKKTA